MKEIMAGQGLTLIYKYECYYIRFEAGEIASRVYDLKISKEEADDIIKGAITMDNVINQYISQGKCRENILMIEMINDYLLYEKKYNLKESKATITKLAQFPEIFRAFVNYLIEEKLSDRDVTSEGYTAKIICDKLGISALEGYLFLVDIRNSPKDALARLK